MNSEQQKVADKGEVDIVGEEDDMARLLLGRDLIDDDLRVGDGLNISRSYSAPPVSHLVVSPTTASLSELLSVGEEPYLQQEGALSPDDPRLDPTYPAIFHARHRLDPRLPPPIYTPGQSWQRIWGKQQQQQQQAQNGSAPEMPAPVGTARKRLVDMIQEDFPRTPSPVYGRPSGGAPSSTTGTAASGEDFLAFSLNRMALSSHSGEDVAVESTSPPVLLPARLNALPPSTVTFGLGAAAVSPNAAPFTPSFHSSAAASPGSLLEEFRSSRQQRRFELADLAGHIVEFSMDQHGSRLIQQRLEQPNCTSHERSMVLNELLPAALPLMTDVFGNYVIQKFFELGSPSQRTALASTMHGHILALSLQMYGCRVVQKALEHLTLPEQTRLMSELEEQVLRCVKDQNGNHVVQKCIECMPPEATRFLLASFRGQVPALATHPYGCRVMQRVFEHGEGGEVRLLIAELHDQVPSLVTDQYGNYVVQHLLEHGLPGDRRLIIQQVLGRVLLYSRHKFASNVVEKCVAHGTNAERHAIIEEILRDPPAGSSDLECPLLIMMRDQFANYVVQKMLEVVDGSQRDLLLQRIRPHLPSLRRYPYGKHIISKVEQMDQLQQRQQQVRVKKPAIDFPPLPQ